MNVKELAEQAGWWVPIGLPSDWDDGDYVVSPAQMKKFAELIVKECAIFLKDTMDDHFAAEQLEEHFGVEE